MFTWIDILIILVILFYTFDGYRQGFLRMFLDILGIILAFIIALKYYPFMANLLFAWGMNINLTKPIGFFTLWTLSQLIFYLLIVLVLRLIPSPIHTNKINRYLGIVPGLAKGTMIISIFLIILMILPFSSNLKNNLSNSLLSGELIQSTAAVENQLGKVLGNLNNTLTFLGTTPDQEDKTILNFKTNDFSIDGVSEKTMLQLVNSERVKNGLIPLKEDILIRNVARAHSMDMLRNGYFAHTDSEDQTPYTRLMAAGVTFNSAGENLALAPSIDLAHIGLMNSTRHRDNILDPGFSRIGIGVIDAGPFGKMITQNFAD